MPSQQNDSLSTNAVLLVRVLSFFAVGLGFAVLCGWFFGIDSLKSILPSLVSMKVNTALGILLLGWVLSLQTFYFTTSHAALLLRRTALALVLAIGFLTLSEHLFGWNTGIDQFFFQAPANEVLSPFAGRPSLLTTLCLVFLGIALLLTELNSAWNIVQGLATISMLIALLPLGGYLYGDISFPHIGSGSQMAAHTALGFLSLSVGILTITSTVGFFAKLQKRLPKLGVVIVSMLMLAVGGAVIHGLEQNKIVMNSLEKTYKISLNLEMARATLFEFSNQAMYFELDNDKDFHRKNITLSREQLLSELDTLKLLTTDDYVQQQRLIALLSMIDERIASVERLIQKQNWEENNEFDLLNQKITQQFEVMEATAFFQLSKEQNAEKLSKDTSSMSVIFSLVFGLALILWTFRALQSEIVESKRLACELDLEKYFLEHRIEDRTHDLWKMNMEYRELNATLEKRVEERTAKLQEMNDEFRVLNETLAQSIEEEVKNSREKDSLLLQQSRLAAMGEMMGNIAHQWRQPINALNLVLANIEDAYRYDDLTEEYLHQQVAKGERLVKSMSSTIDDFRNFFKSDGSQETFDVSHALADSLNIVEASFKHNEIAVEIIAPETVNMRDFAGQYKQVLLNILGNAKDALVERNVKNAKIVVTIAQENEQAVVRIHDNAGGISDDVIAKVFDPYFTTRPQGSGIGLYMSKMIIENNMGGKLSVKNVESGAEFVIKTELSRESLPHQMSRMRESI